MDGGNHLMYFSIDNLTSVHLLVLFFRSNPVWMELRTAWSALRGDTYARFAQRCAGATRRDGKRWSRPRRPDADVAGPAGHGDAGFGEGRDLQAASAPRGEAHRRATPPPRTYEAPPSPWTAKSGAWHPMLLSGIPG